MACRIAEHQTMSRVRLMVETLGPGSFDAGRGALEVVDEEIDVEQRGIIWPTRWDVISDPHELQAHTLTAHGRPFHVVDERDLAARDIGVEGRQSRWIRAGQRH